MASIEQIELDRHRAHLASDLRSLVEKYRAIFEWDVPDVTEALMDRLIIGAIRQVLLEVEGEIP